jgi:hypothetical protein
MYNNIIIINSWTGRTGNNILQIIRAIHYAMINNYDYIQFQKHSLLKSNNIKLRNIASIRNTQHISDTFFSLKKYNITDPEPYIMKKYFQEYIKPIFNIEIKSNNNANNDNTVYIHFRGGDIFSNNPHKAYVQPPLSYYENIINHYDNVKMVCEDRKNPCINELLKHKKTIYICKQYY